MAKLTCDNCGFNESKVLDQRPSPVNNRLIRRRECLSCHKRYTTYEVTKTYLDLLEETKETFDSYKECFKKVHND